jgi:hypothetical protein
MLDRFPSLRIKRKGANGQLFELEIRPSLLRWVLVVVLVAISLVRGVAVEKMLQMLPLLEEDCTRGHIFANEKRALRELARPEP